MDASGSGYGPVTGSLEHCYEFSGSIKSGEFLDQLSDLDSEKSLAPWG
jgi:hypothetical protein